MASNLSFGSLAIYKDRQRLTRSTSAPFQAQASAWYPARAPALWIFACCDRIRSDPEDGESVVVGAQVAAGVSDVGASREPEGADRQVPERGDRSRSGTGSDVGVVLAEGDIPGPVEPVLHRPVPALVVAEVLGSGQRGGQAGDSVDDLLRCPAGVVEFSDVAAEPKHLSGPGEQGVIGLGGADRTPFTAAMAALVGPG